MTFIPYLPNEDLDLSFQSFSEAYKELCERLRAQVPKLKHIDLYYGQEQFVDSDGNWMPFRAPAAFLEFQTINVASGGDGVQLITTDVVVRVVHETVQDTSDRSKGQQRSLEFFGLMQSIHRALHRHKGQHHGPMSRVGLGRLDGPPYWYMYQQTYRCVITDNSASPEYRHMDPPIALEIDPKAGPSPGSDGLVVVRNSDDSYHVELPPGTELHVLPNVEHTDSDGSKVMRPGMTPFVASAVPPAAIPMLKFIFGPGDGALLGDNPDGLTITADVAGTYTNFSQDGNSGSIEYRLNGGNWTVLTGSLGLAEGDLLGLRRQYTDAFGYVLIQGE